MDMQAMLQRMQQARGGAGGAAPDQPLPDTAEKIQISSLSLLKMLKHGRAGVPMEVMGLMLGQFVDDYTITCVDVFAMPQVSFDFPLPSSLSWFYPSSFLPVIFSFPDSIPNLCFLIFSSMHLTTQHGSTEPEYRWKQWTLYSRRICLICSNRQAGQRWW